MFVRLAFAVAAHLDPEILVVDEVLAVGDVEFQNKCIRKMDDVSTKEGKTILFVSHNMNSIEQLCTSAVLLEDGKLKKGMKKNTGPSSSLFTGEVKSIPLISRQSKEVGRSIESSLFIIDFS